MKFALALAAATAAYVSALPAADVSDNKLEARWGCPPEMRWDPKTHKCYSPARHPSWDNCKWLGQCYDDCAEVCYDCDSSSTTCPKGLVYDPKTYKCFNPKRHPSTQNCKYLGLCYSWNRGCYDCQQNWNPPPCPTCQSCPWGEWADKNGNCCNYNNPPPCSSTTAKTWAATSTSATWAATSTSATWGCHNGKCESSTWTSSAAASSSTPCDETTSKTWVASSSSSTTASWTPSTTQSWTTTASTTKSWTTTASTTKSWTPAASSTTSSAVEHP